MKKRKTSVMKFQCFTASILYIYQQCLYYVLNFEDRIKLGRRLDTEDINSEFLYPRKKYMRHHKELNHVKNIGVCYSGLLHIKQEKIFPFV